MKIKAVYNSNINKKICIGNHTFVNGHPIVIDVDENEAARLKELGKQDWFNILEEYPMANESAKVTPVKKVTTVKETPVVKETPAAEEPVPEATAVVEDVVVEEPVVEEASAIEDVAAEEPAPEEAPKKKTRKSTKKDAESEE